MYSVSKQTHPQYGNIVEIIREDTGEFISPFDAYRKVVKLYREWRADKKIKVRVLVDSQVITLAQADSWSINEYKSLPKCEECAKILEGPIFTHQLSGEKLFCSKICADNNYAYIISNRDEEEEFDL